MKNKEKNIELIELEEKFREFLRTYHLSKVWKSFVENGVGDYEVKSFKIQSYKQKNT